MDDQSPFGPERWEPEIRDRFLAHTHHQFVLHQNIFDYVRSRDGGLFTTIDYLFRRVDRWLDGEGEPFAIKVSFSQSRGFDFYEQPLGHDDGKDAKNHAMTDMEGLFRRAIKPPPPASLPQAPHEALPLLDKLLLQDEHRTLVVLEYLEKIAPASRTNQQPVTSLIVEMLHQWGHDLGIRRAGHLIIMVTYNLGQVEESLYAATSGCYPVAISLPTEQERLAYLRFVSGMAEQGKPKSRLGLARLEDGMCLESLARNTTGFSLKALDETNRLALKRGVPIAWSVVRDRKREIIEAESEGLLEIVEPEHGFADVGGLSQVKQYLQQVAAIFHRDRKSPTVPKGLLFVGPPGVGKTHLAQAFAHESSMNFVIMRNIRSKWVGESERNLGRVLNLAKSIAPVCIFVDEVDQALGGRAATGGDSGVGQRIFGRILEEMGSNANRGELLWICATNRPDFMDAAMVSRFDRVIPFLPPTESERVEILKALGVALGLRFTPGLDLRSYAQKCQDLTGREMEIVLRRALEIAASETISAQALSEALEDFKPNHERAQYQLQALLAIRSTNLRHFLPDPIPYAEVVTDGRIDLEKLDDEILKLRSRLARM